MQSGRTPTSRRPPFCHCKPTLFVGTAVRGDRRASCLVFTPRVERYDGVYRRPGLFYSGKRRIIGSLASFIPTDASLRKRWGASASRQGQKLLKLSRIWLMSRFALVRRRLLTAAREAGSGGPGQFSRGGACPTRGDPSRTPEEWLPGTRHRKEILPFAPPIGPRFPPEPCASSPRSRSS